LKKYPLVACVGRRRVGKTVLSSGDLRRCAPRSVSSSSTGTRERPSWSASVTLFSSRP